MIPDSAALHPGYLLAQCTYMDEETFEYEPERVADVQKVIRALLEACVED